MDVHIHILRDGESMGVKIQYHPLMVELRTNEHFILTQSCCRDQLRQVFVAKFSFTNSSKSKLNLFED